MSCGGSCGSCGGCGRELTITEGEAAVLRTLGQIPFLPVARRADSMEPFYLEETEYSPAEYSLILQALEKKGLISLDYDKPLSGAGYSAYRGFPVHGSMALTARGQTVLELLELQFPPVTGTHPWE